MKRKFWNWVRNEGERTLFLNGEISDETWYGDEVTPKLFKDELLSGEGDITIWINSPGGDVFAAAQIYNMLMDYKGNVTVKIDGLAASAASVIAMAGTKVLMSPVAMTLPTAETGLNSVAHIGMTEPETSGKSVSEKEEHIDIGSDKVITSPLVGTFYSAPSPEADPFVQVGDTVKKGQVLGIIEAMKLMNEIESDYDGTIVEIYVENGQAVEYGQPLFRIK